MGHIYAQNRDGIAHLTADLMVRNLQDLLEEQGYDIHCISLCPDWQAKHAGRGMMSVSGTMVIVTGHGDRLDVPYDIMAHVRKITQGWTFGRRSDSKGEARKILHDAAMAVKESDEEIERRFES